MNKVILMGRLTRDPEIRYSQAAQPLAITRYSLAVNRRFKREGQPDADFINVVSFGKSAEFASKYFKKGQMVSVVGRLQISVTDGEDGKKNYYTDVVVEEQFFTGGKGENNTSTTSQSSQSSNQKKEGDFISVNDELEDDDLPF